MGGARTGDLHLDRTAVPRLRRVQRPYERNQSSAASEAAALDLYGPRLGLPPVVSMAGTFYVFGPGDEPGEVMLFVGAERESVEKICPSLELATRITAEWTVEAFHLRATEHQSKRRRRPAARPLTGSPPAPARRIPP